MPRQHYCYLLKDSLLRINLLPQSVLPRKLQTSQLVIDTFLSTYLRYINRLLGGKCQTEIYPISEAMFLDRKTIIVINTLCLDGIGKQLNVQFQ